MPKDQEKMKEILGWLECVYDSLEHTFPGCHDKAVAILKAFHGNLQAQYEVKL